MPEHKLTTAQHTQLLQWIAEGLTNQEINSLSASFDPPFSVTAQHAYYFRKKYDAELTALRDEIDNTALTTGLSIRANRVGALIRLAKMLEDDLLLKNKLWLENAKGIGSGDDFEKITFEDFNASEIRELRGIYDDIAKETGGRIQRMDITSKNKQIKGYVAISPDDWDTPAAPSKGRKSKKAGTDES